MLTSDKLKESLHCLDVQSANCIGDTARDTVGPVVGVAHGEEGHVDDRKDIALNKPGQIGEKISILVGTGAVVEL